MQIYRVSGPPIWTPSLNVCAQAAHILGSWVIGLACWLIGWPEWAPIAITVGFALVKEFGFDLFIERDDLGWPGSLEDFSFYMAGMAILAAVRFGVQS